LTISQYQFALAATDRDQCVDYGKAGLQGMVTGARFMMGAAGRSVGSRLVEATGPFPSSARPSGSMTRPSRPSPTATSITRPVRNTLSPVCTLHNPQQHDADLGLVHIESNAEHSSGKLEEFSKPHRKAGNIDNSR